MNENTIMIHKRVRLLLPQMQIILKLSFILLVLVLFRSFVNFSLGPEFLTPEALSDAVRAQL